MAARRLPLEPLVRLLGYCPDATLPKETIAELLGVSPRQFGRMLEEGVSTKVADRICARAANIHPTTVWGGDFHGDIDHAALPDDPDLLFDPKVSFA